MGWTGPLSNIILLSSMLLSSILLFMDALSMDASLPEPSIFLFKEFPAYLPNSRAIQS